MAAPRMPCARSRVVGGKRWLVAGLAALLWAGAGAVGKPMVAGPAASWPGLWGPHRDARVEGPLPIGPGMRIREVWRRAIGKGFSEVAAIGSQGYTMFSDGEVDHLAAFDLATGNELWRIRLEPTYRGHDGSDDGPISTPVVAAGRIFALNPFGKLFAFDLSTRRELWRLDLQAALGGVAPYWGFATTPLPVGQTLVVQAGGEQRNNLVALDMATGRTVWSSQPANQNGYSSPVLMTLAGVPQIVAITTDKVFGVRPADGSVLWTHDALGEPRQPPVPLPGDRIFVTSWEQSAVLKVSLAAGAWQVEELWRKPELKANFSPTVYHDGYLYGMNGAFLTCLAAQAGEVTWRQRVYDASLLLVGDELAVLGNRSGSFQLVAATPRGFREDLKVRVFNSGARSLTGPMFLGGRFLLRNGEEMVMFEVSQGGGGGVPAAAGRPR